MRLRPKACLEDDPQERLDGEVSSGKLKMRATQPGEIANLPGHVARVYSQ
jgi:hypothetical protein